MGARRPSVCGDPVGDHDWCVCAQRAIEAHSAGSHTVDDGCFVDMRPRRAVSAVFYGVAYGRSFGAILRLIASMVLVDFVLVGLAVSTLAWYKAPPT